NLRKEVAVINEFKKNRLRRVLGDLFARCVGDEAGAIPLTYPILYFKGYPEPAFALASTSGWLFPWI
ncbi:hypothetical protein, partial [Moorena sp. SIO4E2]|uniref:hypothetical protein n=1 Tax=Moorena sp. SIO4E2 TaxID=2607826 RepID=UPI00257CDD85